MSDTKVESPFNPATKLGIRYPTPFPPLVGINIAICIIEIS